MRGLPIVPVLLLLGGGAGAQNVPATTSTIFQNFWTEAVAPAEASFRVQRLEVPGRSRLDSVFSMPSRRLLRVENTTWQPTGDTLTTTTRWRANGQLFTVLTTIGRKQHGPQLYYDTSGKLKRKVVAERGNEVKAECFSETGAAIACAGAVYVEKMPVFPGRGKDAMLDYIGRSVRYPKAALKQRLQGLVLMRFVVSETGEMRDVQVQKGLSPELDAEATRVISSMSTTRWMPGMQDGEPMPVMYTVPISFAIN
ncbi:TonB protein C-terminal [Hymenobacter daecheongensis DSM 21074]|uniref:TonB protein C-terminal n=1 Tax=Hymenobacter daecheongensis DSM 21074 TaxID=1121955 RepID=A0A1M6K098_9BACT|nr:energy transducer TonB [Hymenobacter daecheongensis]SHJ52328.1 TonB protein C-terminal [Hymenobacter daecheongensis DSM 21074]